LVHFNKNEKIHKFRQQKNANVSHIMGNCAEGAFVLDVRYMESLRVSRVVSSGTNYSESCLFNSNSNSNSTIYHQQLQDCLVSPFRPFALRARDNAALQAAVKAAKQQRQQQQQQQQQQQLKFVFLWHEHSRTTNISGTGTLVDRRRRGGGTASHVFLVQALAALNQTLEGQLDVVSATNETDVLALQAYGQQLGSASLELFYLETYNATLEQHLHHQLLQSCFLQIQSFATSQTLLDYTDRNVAELIRTAIQEHSFASPLIPFVDFVVNTLAHENNQEIWNQNDDTDTMLSLIPSFTCTNIIESDIVPCSIALPAHLHPRFD